MKLKLEKNLKIISEMILYFKNLGNKNVHLDFAYDETKSSFSISGDVSNISTEKLNELNNILNSPRQKEVEECYWQLGGESELNCELSLIGAMIDSAQIEYKDGILKVKMLRKEI